MMKCFFSNHSKESQIKFWGKTPINQEQACLLVIAICFKWNPIDQKLIQQLKLDLDPCFNISQISMVTSFLKIKQSIQHEKEFPWSSLQWLIFMILWSIVSCWIKIYQSSLHSLEPIYLTVKYKISRFKYTLG